MDLNSALKKKYDCSLDEGAHTLQDIMSASQRY